MMDVLPLWVEIVFLCCGAVLAVLIGKPVIRTLRRLRLGQPISEYLAEHKAKEGTPTCGGAIFIIPALLLYAAARLYLTFVKPDAYGAGPAAKLDMVILLAVLNAAIGLADDVLKLRKKRHPELKRFEMDNEGLRRWHKFGLQALAAASVLALGRLTGALDTTFSFRDVNADLGIWFYPIAFFFILYVINAVNLTDGLDGLAGSVAAVALCVSGAVYCVSGMSLLLFGVQVSGHTESEYRQLSS